MAFGEGRADGVKGGKKKLAPVVGRSVVMSLCCVPCVLCAVCCVCMFALGYLFVVFVKEAKANAQ